MSQQKYLNTPINQGLFEWLTWDPCARLCDPETHFPRVGSTEGQGEILHPWRVDQGFKTFQLFACTSIQMYTTHEMSYYI